MNREAANAALAERMNRFPEVAWDRWGGWYEYPGDADGIHSAGVFGWIDREDGRFDFMSLHVFWTDADGVYAESYTTSSAALSAEFAERLGVDHVECRRIEDDLGSLVENVIRLKAAV